MATGRPDVPQGSHAGSQRDASVDALIDRAVAAINRGDRSHAAALAGQVLAADKGNTDAEDLLAAPGDAGEIRRLTLLFADLVDSTALSTRVEPETNHSVVGRYREQVRRIVAHYEGHIGGTAGDGILAVFGHPVAHGDDARRAVLTGMDVVAEVARISRQARDRFGIEVNVRVGVHRGLVYLDTAQDDVYGLAANLVARVSGLAAPGQVMVSSAIEALVRNDFELADCAPAPVKGVEELITHYRLIAERATPDRSARSPLVGRRRERRRLHEAWAHVQSGTSAEPGLLFRGEPGIGKSRLAEEAADLVRASGGVVLELVGSPYHAEVGLHPVRVLLERQCGIDRHTTTEQRLLLLEAEIAARGLDPVTAVPALAPVLAIAPEHGYTPVAAEGLRLGELIAASVRSYLLARIGDTPALLVAEDLQWFDQSTLGVVGSMLDSGRGRLLVLLTGRDGDWLPAQWHVETFDLAPLSDEQTDELITAIDPTVNEEERATVRSRCDGMPFYIEQVVAGLRMTSSSDRRVPDALYEPLLARLRAGTHVVPVVEAAAVIGRHIDRSLLTAVVDLDQTQVDEVIGQLIEARVLEPTGRDTWRFRHELLREVVDELAPPSVRRRIHARVADAMVQGVTADPDWLLVASHYQEAAQHADAAAAYQRATAAARRRGALAEARTYLTQALTQLEHCPPGPARDRSEIAPRLERGYLTATAEGAQSPVAVADFERCLQLVGTDLRDDELVATLCAVGAYYMWRADLPRASQLMELMWESTEHARRWFRPAIAGSLGIVAWLRGEFDTARKYFDQAATGVTDEYENRLQAIWTAPHDPVALAHEHLAWDHLIRGELDSAQARLGEAVDRADRLGYPQRPYNHLYAIDMKIWVHAEAGQFDRARALVEELVEKSDRFGLDHLYWQLLGATEKAMVDGRASLAGRTPKLATIAAQIDALTQVIEVWQALGASTYRPFYWCTLGQLLIAAGRLDEARVRLNTALQFTADTGICFYSAELLRALAHTHGDSTSCAEGLAAARELARAQGAWLFELRSALDDVELRGEPARHYLAEAFEKMPMGCPLPELARARAALKRRGTGG